MVGDVGLAQASLDYDVDSNPEGWTERLRVKGLGGLWALARWIHYSLLWSAVVVMFYPVAFLYINKLV